MFSALHTVGIFAIVGAGVAVTLGQLGSDKAFSSESDPTIVKTQQSANAGGFRDYRFGMTEDEISALTEVGDTSTMDSGSRVISSANPVKISGEEYDLSFRVGETGLYLIRLRRMYDNSFIGRCNTSRDDHTAALSAQYGPVVGQPNQTAMFGSLLTTVTLSGTESMSVSVTSLYIVSPDQIENGNISSLPVEMLPGTCSIVVLYKDRVGQSGGF